jgi:hypothetical protein
MLINFAIASKKAWMNIAHHNWHKSLLPPVLGVWLVFFACATVLGDNAGHHAPPQISEQTSSDVTVRYSNLDNETVYSISSENCAIDWIARNSEIGVIIHRAKCTIPLSRQLPLLTQICTEFFSKDKNAPAFRTLFWGRLSPDGSNPASQELSLRIAMAAYESHGWNVKKGRPKNGDINGFIRDLANRKMIYPELKELFERFHKKVTFSCAEKVLVLEAGKLPFFAQLKLHGIQASDRLPFDCMAWFSVSAQ